MNKNKYNKYHFKKKDKERIYKIKVKLQINSK